MMHWILDDGPFGHLAKVCSRYGVVHWESRRLWVANTTAMAASPPSRQLLAAEVDNDPLVSTFEISLGAGDPAEQVLVDLHPDISSTTDLAEHESIAWALVHDPEAVFVCADRRASLTALAELGRRRVAHPFDLWLDLRSVGWLSPGMFEDLCQLTYRHDQGLPRMPQRVSEKLEEG